MKSTFDHSLYHGLQRSPVFRISISGGPCGGKTTLIQKIKDQFTQTGFRVLTLPQVATMVSKAGVNINTSQMGLEEKIMQQAFILRMKIFMEDQFYKLALHNDQPTIILSDRGTMDSCAYVTKDQFNIILDQQGWNLINLRDKRYDAVIFLTTAADGAEQYYTLANNQARHESLEFSKELDLKTLQAWNGHPHLLVIENVKGESFQQKLMRAVHTVQKIIGVHKNTIQSKKFLVDSVQFPKNVDIETFEVEQIFLTNPDPDRCIQEKVRKRGQKGSYTYHRNLRLKGQKQGEVNQIRIPLTPIEYLTLASTRASADHLVLKKSRKTFLYQKQVFILDEILLDNPITILRYTQKQGCIITPPDFIKLGLDITKDEKYKSNVLAKKKIHQLN